MNAPVINAEVLAGAGGGGLLGKGIFGLHQVPGKALGRAGRALGAPQGAQINFHVSAFPEPPPAKVELSESNIQIQKRASRTIPN